MKRTRFRWPITLLILALALLFINIYPIPSLLSWQSQFLARCFFILMLCFALCLVRILLGPTALDRAVVINALGVMIVGFCAVLSISTGRDWYIDIAIAWALQSFIGALALAKYLEGKGLNE